MMAMMQTSMEWKPPAPFDFAGTAHSHGWVVLAPNEWDSERQVVKRVERLRSGKVILIEMRGTGTVGRPRMEATVTHRSRLGQRDCREIETLVRHMFRLEEDLSGFYEKCREHGPEWTPVTAGLGRLLRSPHLFEDVVKVICTTNIQWSGTKSMVAELVGVHGESYPGDGRRRAFPAAEDIVRMRPDEFAGSVRMGYRAPYVYELAERVAAGKLRLEEFEDSTLPTAELRKRLLDIRGLGPYAASSLLMLLGRYDSLAVDTVCRDFVRKKYFDGRPASDAEIRRVYTEWGEWQYLACWFDIWRSYRGEF